MAAAAASATVAARVATVEAAARVLVTGVWAGFGGGGGGERPRVGCEVRLRAQVSRCVSRRSRRVASCCSGTCADAHGRGTRGTRTAGRACGSASTSTGASMCTPPSCWCCSASSMLIELMPCMTGAVAVVRRLGRLRLLCAAPRSCRFRFRVYEAAGSSSPLSGTEQATPIFNTC